MELGSRRKKIDYSKYVVTKFAPTLFNDNYELVGCGSTVVSTITGLSPFAVSKENKYKSEYTDKFVYNYLRCRGYKVIPIRKLEVTGNVGFSENITKNHVLLVSQIYDSNNSSYSLIYKDVIYHNFVSSRLNNLEFI
ncbi:MAG: hypothetical protein AABY22_04885, partial [Nanoarchaeota archaeon]